MRSRGSCGAGSALTREAAGNEEMHVQQRKRVWRQTLAFTYGCDKVKA